MKKIINTLLIFLAIVLYIMQTPVQAKENEKTYRTNELVEIVKFDPTIKLDVRYATPNNFLHRAVYNQAKVFLQKPVAESLTNVQKNLREKGIGLLVFDGYRPWFVTKIFWDETPPEKRKFVADPSVGSIHNRGCAVDLTLYNLMTGKALKMPCEYDTFSEEAYPTFKGSSKEQRENRDLLIKSMEQEGFKVHPNEWWHFNHKDCNFYKVLDIPLKDL